MTIAGLELSGETPLWAVPSLSLAVTAHERNIIESLELASAVLDASNAYKRVRDRLDTALEAVIETDPPVDDPAITCMRQDLDRADDHVSALWSRLLAQFQESYAGGVLQEHASEVLCYSSNSTSGTDFEILRRLSQMAVPLSIVRALQYRDRVHFTPEKVKEWDRFVDIYIAYLPNL